MAELHIDSDWKKQAQEEKRRLAEQAEKERAARQPAAATSAAPSAAPGGAPGAPGGGTPAGRAGREMPPASFAGLVQTLMTQAFFYLGELAPQGTAPSVNLDMAKHNIDLLSVLEGKTRGNLADDEQQMLDTALYELRMRFVAVCQRYIQ